MPGTALLRSVTILLSPVALFLVYLQSKNLAAETERYWPALSTAAAAAVSPTAPLCAALAAWEASRLRRAGIQGLAPGRSRIEIAFSSLVPVLLLGLAAHVLGLVVIWVEASGLPGSPAWSLLATGFAVTLAFCLLGFAVGSLIPVTFAVPVVLAGTWIWLMYPRAVEPFWLRHLNGSYMVACCKLDEVPAQGSISGSLIVAGAIAVSGLFLILSGNPGRLKLSVAALMPVAAVAASVPFVDDLGPDAAEPRTEGLVCLRAPGGLEACGWRENRSRLAWAAGTSEEIMGRFAAAGLEVPRKLTERVPKEAGQWRFSIPPRKNDVDLVLSIVPFMVPFPEKPPPSCVHDWRGPQAAEAMIAWLSAKAGLSPATVSQTVSSDAVETVRKVMRRPDTEQLVWYKQNQQELTHCVRPPAPEVVS